MISNLIEKKLFIVVFSFLYVYFVKSQEVQSKSTGQLTVTLDPNPQGYIGWNNYVQFGAG